MLYLSGYGIPAFSCPLQETNDLFRAQWKNMEKAFLNEGLSQAKLCVGGCKALRWRLQSFALAVAKLCVGRCNALRRRVLT